MRRTPHALVLAVIAASRVSVAAPPDSAAPASPDARSDASPTAAAPGDELAARSGPPGNSYELLGSLFFGDGLRFNNPYRLSSQLGESARTVSVTSPYVDLGAAFALGDAFGLRHGAALNLSLSLSGVGQAAFSPAYFVSYRSTARFMAFGRLGAVVLLSPDSNAGGEIGLGGAAFLTGKIALAAEIVGDLVYGAATRETGYAVYPVISLQLGLLLDHEVLP